MGRGEGLYREEREKAIQMYWRCFLLSEERTDLQLGDHELASGD
jgi:hypothetical protein